MKLERGQEVKDGSGMILEGRVEVNKIEIHSTKFLKN